jgi:acetyltransferase-like isoleucine patch superfamily enzyme
MIGLLLSKINLLFKFYFLRIKKFQISKTSFVQFWKFRLNNFKNTNIIIDENSYIDSDIIFEKYFGVFEVGKNSFIGGATFSIAESILIGNNAQIAWGTLFFDHNSHSLDYKIRSTDLVNRFNNIKLWDNIGIKKIIIEDDVWIGANSIILKGVILKQGTVIAAGSVVTKSTEPFSLYGGNPAKFIKKLEND